MERNGPLRPGYVSGAGIYHPGAGRRANCIQPIENWADEKFDFGDYVDHYEAKVRELIEAKVEGRELVTPEADDEPEVVNLMDALRRSVHRGSGKRTDSRAVAKPKRAATPRHRVKRRKAS